MDLARYGRSVDVFRWFDSGGDRRGTDLAGVEACFRLVEKHPKQSPQNNRREDGSTMQVQVVKVPRFVGKILQVVLGFWAKKK